MKPGKRNVILLITGILVLSIIGVYANSVSTDTYQTIGNYSVNDSGQFYKGNKDVTNGLTVCRGTSLANDIYNNFFCNYNCASNDDDCSQEINAAITAVQNGGIVLLTGQQYPIKSSVLPKYSVTIKGNRGIEPGGANPVYFTYDTFTRLKWTGANGGRMIDVDGAILNFGIEDLALDGNWSAGYGIYKSDDGVNRAKHLDLQRMTLFHINGSGMEFAGQVDDTSLYEVYFEWGGANSVGLKSPNTQIKMFGGSFYGLNTGVLITGPQTPGISFNGVVFGDNDNDLILNSSNSYTLPISFINSWFEPGSGRENIIKMTYPSELYGIDFVSCNIGTDSTSQSVIDLQLATAGQLSFFGGRSYIPAEAKILGNGFGNLTVSFFNHYQSEKYNVSYAQVNNFGNNLTLSSSTRSQIALTKVGASAGTTKIYDDGSLNIQAHSDVFSNAGTWYNSANFRLFGGSYDLTIDKLGGHGKVIACLDNDGKLYAGNATGCP